MLDVSSTCTFHRARWLPGLHKATHRFLLLSPVSLDATETQSHCVPAAEGTGRHGAGAGPPIGPHSLRPGAPCAHPTQETRAAGAFSHTAKQPGAEVSATWSPSRGHAAPHVVGGRADPSELQGPASPGVRPPQLTPPGPHGQPSLWPRLRESLSFLFGRKIGVGFRREERWALTSCARHRQGTRSSPRGSAPQQRRCPRPPTGTCWRRPLHQSPCRQGTGWVCPQGSLCGQT